MPLSRYSTEIPWSLESYPLAVRGGEVSIAGYMHADLAVVFLVEGTWPRAVVRVGLREAGPAGRDEDVLLSVAGTVLRMAQAPIRWAEALADFLRERASVVSDLEIAHERHDEELAALLAAHTKSEAAVDLEEEIALIRAGEADQVWDLYGGQLAYAGTLPPREEALAPGVCNPGDVSLDTRFIDSDHTFDWHPPTARRNAAVILSRCADFDVPVVHVRPAFLDLRIDVQWTVGKWIEAHGMLKEPAHLLEALAAALSHNYPALRRGPALDARIAALFKESEAARRFRRPHSL